jgi:hypothetical protein
MCGIRRALASRTAYCLRIPPVTWRVVGVSALWPAPVRAPQEHGMGVSRQLDPEQPRFQIARHPSSNFDCLDSPCLIRAHVDLKIKEP